MRTSLGFVALLSLVPPVAGCSSSAGPSGARDEAVTTAAITREPESAGSPLSYVLHAESRPATFYASEVGDSNGPVILLRQGPPDEAVNEILQLDRQSKPLWSTLALNGRDELTGVRTRGSRIATAGTRYLGSEEHTTGEEMDVWGFSSGGQTAFEYAGPADTSGGPLDICADGTVIASGQGTLPDSGASGALVVALDGAGHATWSTGLPGLTITKVRCGGDGVIRVAGSGSTGAFAAQIAAGGQTDWIWNGADAITGGVSMDMDGGGDVVVATTAQRPGGRSQIVLYSVGSAGTLRWSWRSDGRADSLSGVDVADDGTATVAGTRTSGSTGRVYVARVDAGGSLDWATVVPFSGASAQGVGVSVDDAGESFVCATAGTDGGALLIGAKGAARWSYVESSFTPAYADVTGGIGRCVGGAHPNGLADVAVLAFQLSR